ncbi:hypothetical protein [Bradyrhizobium sp. CCGUVB23]|uniref:DUF6894 family protein n=1 Tax=Bradyrhizobium sp. CCGUVB23 TaxID=2949630 RepID=UPI0020B379C6|nr:hypothetical protein [Bradyrhizobium sp. CCGUVB23]MCP3467694.1 hypothetical protein [Bradyrhizobium sp. CCGUVB23]
MRYFFHIVDRYGLFPDWIGCEYADQDAALEHARRLAAELAKTGEFFRSSFVFVARASAPGSLSRSDQPAATQVAGA